jgi:hypothetical protein
VHSHRNALNLFIDGNLDGDGLIVLGFQLGVNRIHIVLPSNEQQAPDRWSVVLDVILTLCALPALF